MTPSQKRALIRKLKAEHDELHDNLKKLKDAVEDITNDISEKQRGLMANQYIFMSGHYQILMDRIADLEEA
ncbi:MAG: hypothetical protein LKF37_10200 [Lentilactobacillus diolivorans]|jgi:hemerythrin-like domain-containing protein|nr:hypothetical protein [Lentilactobacillus diolivorans]